MIRSGNTDNHGNNWSEETKKQIWEKGKVDPNFNSNEWRRDVCGFAMRYSDFGERNSLYGWEIDHIYPVALGGNDDLNNLQPLHWKNNLEKGDKTDWSCSRQNNCGVFTTVQCAYRCADCKHFFSVSYNLQL